MRKVLFIILSAVLMTLAASCGQSRVSRSLSHAEEIMEEHPDSALAILDSLPVAELGSDADRALHALLLTQAQIKNGYTVDSDTLIRRAAAYYSDRDPSPRLMKSLFYDAKVKFNSSRLSEAVVNATKSYNLAKHFGESYWRAKSAELLSDIFSDSYANKEVLYYTTEAVEFYRIAGKHRNFLFSKCDLATAMSNLGKHDNAISLIDSVKSVANIDSDSSLILYADNALLAILTYSGRFSAADKCLDDIKSTDNDHISSPHDIILKAYNQLYSGVSDAQINEIDALDSVAMGNRDKAMLNLVYAQYHKRRGRYSQALKYTENVIGLIDAEMRDVVSQSVVSTQKDYYRNSVAEEQIRTKNSRTINIILIIGFLIIVSILIFAYRYRIRLKNHLIDERMKDILSLTEELENNSLFSNRLVQSNTLKDQKIDSLNSNLHEKTEELESKSIALESLRHELNENKSKYDESKSQIESLFRLQWKHLNSIISLYLERSGNPKMSSSVMSDLEKEIKKLGSNRNIKELQLSLDQYMDGIITRLKQQCPSFTEENITFITLIIAGLSTRSICLLTDTHYRNFYTKKRRIVEKIASSNAPDRELFISKMK